MDGLEHDTTVAWQPQAGSQMMFLTCPVFEVLYAGTRGPGKTDALLMDFLQHVGEGWGAEWKGILFRRQQKDLQDVITKSQKWFPRILAGARFNRSELEWRFPEGERLLFRHLRVPDDYQAYHGHAYPWIGFEELIQWPDDTAYKLMISCCRSSAAGMPRKLRATTNPYGRGHHWVKARFELPAMAGRVINAEGQPPRAAIQGYLAENRIMLQADPGYVDRIREAARNPGELKAWLEGSWDIVAGGMVDDLWDARVHVIQPFAIPGSWRVNRAFDWGSSKPFSVGWYAEADGSTVETSSGPRSTVPGDLFRINEWYGCTRQPNTGLRMLARDIAAGIVRRELDWGIHGRVQPGPADASIFDVENGVSIADDMAEPVRIDGDVYPGIEWEPSDKSPGSRKQGWEQLRKRLANARRQGYEPREYPGLFIFRDRCPHFLRTVPTLPRDDQDLDDVDTDAEDHIGDEVRYRLRWRPAPRARVWD
jgi:hypothetical protein